MTTEISVTRALAQIKSLDGRIAKATTAPFISYAVGKKSAGGQPVAEVEATLKANLQSVQDMIALRAKLKVAVVASNAATPVTIAGQSMTVAQAIERKGSIDQEVALLAQLRSQLAAATQRVETTNVQVQQRLDVLIQTAVGKDRKVEESEVAGIVNPFREQNEAKLIDPTEISKQIETLQARINDFLLEVDYALSEVNAVTKITVA